MAFHVEITNWGKGGCNSLKWLAFPKFQLIAEVVVIIGGGGVKLKILNIGMPLTKYSIGNYIILIIENF